MYNWNADTFIKPTNEFEFQLTNSKTKKKEPSADLAAYAPNTKCI